MVWVGLRDDAVPGLTSGRLALVGIVEGRPTRPSVVAFPAEIMAIAPRPMLVPAPGQFPTPDLPDGARLSVPGAITAFKVGLAFREPARPVDAVPVTFMDTAV